MHGLSFTLRPGTELSRKFYAATPAQQSAAVTRYTEYRDDWCYEEQGLPYTFEEWLGHQYRDGEQAAYEERYNL